MTSPNFYKNYKERLYLGCLDMSKDIQIKQGKNAV